MDTSFLVLPRPADIKGARSSLDWTQMELAHRCGVNTLTIAYIENRKSKPSKKLLEKITQVFMAEDIYFHPEGGYKVDANFVKVFEGEDGYLRAQEDVFKACLQNKDEVLFLGVDDERSGSRVIENESKIYEAGIPCKYIMSKDKDYILGPLEEYRKVDSSYFFSVNVVVIYKYKTSFLSNGEDEKSSARVVVINDKGITEQMRRYFNTLWDKGDIPKKSSAKQIFFRNTQQ